MTTSATTSAAAPAGPAKGKAPTARERPSPKRRSPRDRSSSSSSSSPAAAAAAAEVAHGKLTPLEVLGSRALDVLKSERGWTVKEDRNGIWTYKSHDGTSFPSFEAIADHVISSDEIMEDFSGEGDRGDGGVVDALRVLARGGDGRAAGWLEKWGVKFEAAAAVVEEESDEGEGAASVEGKVVIGGKKRRGRPPKKDKAAAAGDGKKKKVGRPPKKARVAASIPESNYMESDVADAVVYKGGLFDKFVEGAEMFFSKFASMVAHAETALEERNAVLQGEVEALEDEVDNTLHGDKERIAELEAEAELKRAEMRENERFHARGVESLAGRLSDDYLMDGSYALPEEMEEKYEEVIDRYYSAITKYAFPETKSAGRKENKKAKVAKA